MRNLSLVPAAALLAGRQYAAAFAPPTTVSCASTTTACPPSPRPRARVDLRAGNDDEGASLDASRRDVLRKVSLAFISTTTAAASLAPQNAEAASDLFKPNPLTNPVLEQMRIWNQDEVDNIKYGGELESGSAKPAAFDQYVGLLQPILTVEGDLAAVGRLLTDGKPSTKEDYIGLFEKIDAILSNTLFDKINFKKAFNAFADNIYYSDPDRANLYLGGGAVTKTTQSIAYLLRNDVLTNIEDMRAETKYLLKEVAKVGEGESVAVGEGGLELEDILGMSRMANEGMKKYLDLVPPKELEAARAKFGAQ